MATRGTGIVSSPDCPQLEKKKKIQSTDRQQNISRFVKCVCVRERGGEEEEKKTGKDLVHEEK